MQLIMRQLGFTIAPETLSVPVPNSEEKMNYQNDIEIKVEGEMVAIYVRL